MTRALSLVVIGLATGAIYAAGLAPARGEHATWLLPWRFYPAFLLYLTATAWVWRRPGLPVWPIVGFALVFRLLAMADPPALSTDVYRYAWDARVQAAGHNPYRYAPADDALAALRDDAVHPHINRPGARTVYPPGGELVFRLLPDSVDGVRLVMIACDLATVLLLVALLRRRGFDPARVVLYAWAPLVVYEVGNGGHLEAAMLPALVGAVLLWHARRDLGAGLLLGLAAAMKLYPVLGAVALAARRPWRVLGAMLAVVGGLYLVYGWPVGADVLGFLPQYFGPAEDHNIGLRALLEAPLVRVAGGHARAVAFGVCVALLVAGAAWIYRHPAPVERQMMRLTGLYLLTLPTALHPWYALWLLPWLCTEGPRAPWLWLTGALPLSYLKYGSPGGVMPAWVVPVELLPTAALWMWEARRGPRTARALRAASFVE